MLTEVLAGFGGAAFLIALLAFLGRSFVGALLAKDLERFKADLVSASHSAVERLKADLQLAAVEHQVRFTRLHEKRAEVLAEMYRLLVEATWAAEAFASPMEYGGDKSKNEKYVDARNAIADYYRFFDVNRIYLPESLCERLSAFERRLRQPVIKFGTYVQIESPTERTFQQMNEAWDAAYQAVSEEIPSARVEIEAEFRKLLGSAPAAVAAYGEAR